ncbi:TetR/AcrR family transcriptional regulator [Saccharomonospora sp. NPDC006951]
MGQEKAARRESDSPREDLVRRAIAHFTTHGIGDTSLRGIAAALDTSHRMLIYHFGSREGLLAALVPTLRRDLEGALVDMAGTPEGSLRDAVWRYWATLIAPTSIAPLFFELSVPAMRDAPWADSFREGSAAWTASLAALLRKAGEPEERAELVARMSMSVVRGVLWELAITGDRAAADATMRAFLDAHWPDRPVSA